MVRKIITVFLSVFVVSSFLIASAQGTDSGKYTASEFFDLAKQKNAQDINVIVNEINSQLSTNTGNTSTTKIINEDLTLWRRYRTVAPIFNTYVKTGSLSAAFSNSNYYYSHQAINKGVSGIADFSTSPAFVTVADSISLPDYKVLAQIIDNEIGRVNSITFIDIGMDSTYWDNLFISIVTDNNRYLIPFDVNTHYCHLENGKIYTEKRAMQIMSTFLEDTDYSKYGSEKGYPGPTDTTEKNPTDEEIAVLGLTDIERYSKTSWETTLSSSGSSQSQISSTSSQDQTAQVSNLDATSIILIVIAGTALTVTIVIIAREMYKKRNISKR